ncbi:guanosine-5'-triphosphate, 3'-diphosphate pyrophosphatase [Campylobacter iguaniorum]|uniref:Guanosine-5'-triphosphate, 3'-diphosphate pyrophosphatase n=1 Tax=Campylobacter iguaniorum TaxID=1244531 RepID=A0A076F783_9BACT|nr:Ppx/GppA phosphatase family protein [Campylobacter iguaniorum]AII14130.1 guanosine-5'-triphosphate, 3'-diphosphate pyrophosphatase [Campylobacter iguaniorum]ALV23869.1 guanosine-5'-triphosphate, 3'-diphosphate pyrophosphatase [Campylobacter iguaniorum]
MPRRVAVIDLGSNSARMAIFERTSRLGFFILREYKIKVRLGEGAYENGGVLQDAAMDNVFCAFSEFKHFIKLYKVNKVLCAGTSALRDAPNSSVFINRIKNELGLGLKIIDGKMEAFYGGVAALNLLSPLSEATTIDIGGGSTELAKIKDGKIIDTISLNIGTVRLKELFFDKKDISGAAKFIDDMLSNLPNGFNSANIIAIGGSLRAISNAIMQIKKHPLKLVHNYSYELKEHSSFIEKLAFANVFDLKDFPVKKDRYDTIREGAMIFSKVAKRLGGKKIHTSGAGVREGIFLSNLLRPGIKFPQNFNPSLRSLQDRFIETSNPNTPKYAKILFDVLKPLHKLDDKYANELVIASKLYSLGRFLGFYSEHAHSSYIVQNGLNYGYTHEQKALISAIIFYQGKLISELGEFKELLPSIDEVRWLSFLLGLAKAVNISDEMEFSFVNHALHIKGIKNFFMVKESIKKLVKPSIFAITFD